MRRKRKTRVRFIPFMRWMLQWYILAFGLIIAMMSIVLLVGKAAARNKSEFDKKWTICGTRFSRHMENKGGNEIIIHVKTQTKKADETITDFLK